MTHTEPVQHAGVEADSPNMKGLVMIIAVIAVFVIGSGIALFYYLQFSARASVASKAAPNPELVKQREKDHVRLDTAGAEAGLTDKDPPINHRPVAEVMQQILADPTLLKHGPPPPAPKAIPGQAVPGQPAPGGATR